MRQVDISFRSPLLGIALCLSFVNTLFSETLFAEKFSSEKFPSEVGNIQTNKGGKLLIPSYFEQNIGQDKNPEVLYRLRQAESVVSFRRDGFSVAQAKRSLERSSKNSLELSKLSKLSNDKFLKVSTLELNFLPPSSLTNNSQATPSKKVSGISPTSSILNYYTGKSASNWHRNVQTYESLKYHELYPGIDALFYRNSDKLEYDFIVNPGANPRDIQVELKGAKKVDLSKDGELEIEQHNGEKIIQKKPFIYQEINNQRQEINGNYRLTKARNNSSYILSFNLEKYDTSLPLIIDPVIVYSTYLGGSLDESLYGFELDSNGDIIIAASVLSSDMPTASPFQGTFGGGSISGDIYVAKINVATNSLVFASYFGGSDEDSAFGTALDSANNLYLAGSTASADFPVTLGAYDTAHANPGTNSDGVILKLSPTGALLYSSFFGGNGDDIVSDIAIDSLGRLIVTGSTTSTDLPVGINPGFQPLMNSVNDVYLASFDSSYLNLNYLSYLGGTGSVEVVYNLLVDSNDNPILSGYTNSADFPLLNAFDSTLDVTENFITKFDASGGSLIFSTFLGGNGFEFSATGMYLDASNNIYLAGFTTSTNFPTFNAYQPVFGGGGIDCAISKFSPTGGIIYSTYFGGTGQDFCNDVTEDENGNIVVLGTTNRSTTFPGYIPTTPLPNAFGINNMFLAKFNSTVTSLSYSTVISGSGNDTPQRLMFNNSTGIFYAVGSTDSSDFPVVNPLQATKTGGVDLLIMGITLPPKAPIILSPLNATSTMDSTPTFSGSAEPNTIVNLYEGITLIGTTTSNNLGLWTITPLNPLALGNRSITARTQNSYSQESENSTATNIEILPAEFNITGTVKLPSGEALGNVKIKVGSKTAVTDANGSFVIPGNLNGNYLLRATSASGANLGTQNVLVANTDVSVTIIAQLSLPNPIYTVWNNFYGQKNTLVLVNKGAQVLNITVQIFDQTGLIQNQRIVTLNPNNRSDLQINQLLSGENKYGTIKLEPSIEGALDGYMYYELKKGSAEQFAYARRFEGVQTGTSTMLFNTIAASKNAKEKNNLIAEWAQLVNTSASNKEFKVSLYDENGLLINSSTLNLAPLQRYDVQAGHEIPGMGKVGMVVVQPTTPDTEYLAQETRYYTNNRLGSVTKSISAAFGQTSRAGTNVTQYGGVSTTNGEQNFLVVSAPSEQAANIQVEVLNSKGELLSSQNLVLPGYGQKYFDISKLLGKKKSGVLRLKSSNGSIFRGDLYAYFYDKAGRVTAAYSESLRPIYQGATLSSYTNGISRRNKVRLQNVSTIQGVSANVRAYDKNGNLLGEKILNLPILQGKEFDLAKEFGLSSSKQLGKIDFVSSVEGVMVAEVIQTLFSSKNSYLDSAVAIEAR